MRLLALAAVLVVSRASFAQSPAPAAPPTSEAAAPAMSPDAFAQLDPAARREALKTLSRDELAAIFEGLSADVLLDEGKQSVEGLGTYTAKLVKQERVDGSLTEAQTLDVSIRQAPFAVRMDYTGGSAKGRRVLYSTAIRANEIRVREPGVKGVFGALWIDINSNLTRADSNHPVTDMGLAAVVRLLQKDFSASAKYGGFKRKNEGFNARGHYCIRFDAPAGAKGLTATWSRVCLDPEYFAPMFVEVHDAKGLYEKYEWSDVKPKALPKDYFTLEGADL